MGDSNSNHSACARCGRVRRLIPSKAVRRPLAEHLSGKLGEKWSGAQGICRACLSEERIDYVMRRLETERGELSEVERDVASNAAQHLAATEHLEQEFERSLTTGQRIADSVARVGGSWPFVIGFFVMLVAWALVNSLLLGSAAFDPYPYILLNLVLSCLAAIQAPVIMMSQNRLNARDRMQADAEFRVNLKSEIEIASLHEKVDHLIYSQWQHLVELQQVQLDLLQELAERPSGRRP